MLETVMTRTFPRVVSGTKPQTEEAQRTPSVPLKDSTEAYSFPNYRESKIKRNPERSQGLGWKCLPYRGTEIRITSNFSFRSHASRKRKL